MSDSDQRNTRDRPQPLRWSSQSEGHQKPASLLNRQPRPKAVKATTTTALTTTAAIPARVEAPIEHNPPTRPVTIFRRVTDTLVQATQAITTPSTKAHYNAYVAETPTNWKDGKHEAALLKYWDIVFDRTANASKLKQQDSTTHDMVAYVKEKLLQAFEELGQGDAVLNAQWITEILVKNRRRPYHEDRQLTRWEMLSTAAAAGGARGGWGPW